MGKEQPICKRAREWLHGNLGPDGALGRFTTSDSRVFSAFLHLLEAYAVEHADDTILAMHVTLQLLPYDKRWLAREAIPCVLDWGDRETLWPKICNATATHLTYTAGLDAKLTGHRRAILAGNVYCGRCDRTLRLFNVDDVEGVCSGCDRGAKDCTCSRPETR